MANDSTVVALIVLGVLDGIALIISCFFLFKGKFRIDKLMAFLQRQFTFCCHRIITVLTVIVVFFMFTPYVFHLVMGIVALLDQSMLPHTGVCIFTLGWFAYSLFISFGHWYFKYFKTTTLFMFLFTVGTLSFWGYLFAVLYMPDYYSFVGASVVFIALNYFFTLSFMSNSFSEHYVRISTLLDEFVLFFTGRPSLNVEGALQKILDNSVQFTKSDAICKRIVLFLMAVATLGVYSGTSYILSEDGHKLVATVNSIYILVSDLILYLYTQWVDPRLMAKANGVVMIIYRGAVAVSVNYWVLGHTVGYLALGLVLVHSILDILIPLKEGKFSWNKNTWLSVGGLFILSLVFLTDMFAASAGYAQALLYQITFTKYSSVLRLTYNNSSYNQYVFGVSAVMVLLAYLFFKIWYRNFYLNNHKFTLSGTVAVLVFWMLAILFGVVAYYQFQTNPTILWTTSAAVCPIGVSAIAFFTCWRENDFSFHSRNPGHYSACVAMPNDRPEDHIDIQQVLSLIIFYVSIIIYGAATTIVFDPPVVGYTTATWVLIVWCGGLGIWEYIGRKHEWGAFSIINFILFLLLITGWSTIYLLVEFPDTEGAQSYVLFCIFATLSIGCLIFALICFVDTEYKIKPIILILFGLSFGSGIAGSVFLWVKWLSFTFIACNIVLAYLVYLYITYKRNNGLNIAYRMSMWAIIGVAVAGIIAASALYSNIAILLVVFGILLGSIAGFFIYLLIEKEGMHVKGHIRIYSTFLFPIYKYDSVTNKMVRSNKSAAFLFTALTMILLWGFIASIALPTDYRYIGLCVSALVAAIGIYYFEYLTFISTTIHNEFILQYLSVNDIFECYKLSASISTDHKDLYHRGKVKQDVDIIHEFNEISVRKSIKFERDLTRKGICSGAACAPCSIHEKKRYNDLKEKLEKARIAQIPALAELKDIDDSAFDDLVYIHQMQEFSAFAHTLYNKMVNKEQILSVQIRKDAYVKNAGEEENIVAELSQELNDVRASNTKFRPVSTIIANNQGKYKIPKEDKRENAEICVVDILPQSKDEKELEYTLSIPNNPGNNVTHLIAKCYGQKDNFTLGNESVWNEYNEDNASDPFVDNEFQKEWINNVNARWLRAKDITPSNYKVSVFTDTISHENVTQGSLGDCWLLSAVISLTVLRPDLIIKIFHPKSRKANAKGYYHLRFFFNGMEREITIDDQFPCDKTNRPIFCKMPVSHATKEKEIWPLLIEKGMAKAYGGYSALRGGTIDSAFIDLTGGGSMRIDFTDPSSQHDIALYRFNPSGSLFGKLKRFMDNGYLLGAATDGEEERVTEYQIVTSHAYAILDVISYDGYHLLQLKNPWGRIEWNGDWSDKSPKWYNRMRKYIKEEQERKLTLLKQQLGLNKAVKAEEYARARLEDGIFWISFEDFVKHFSYVYACRFFDHTWDKQIIRGKWTEGKDGGCTNFKQFYLNPHYIIDITQDRTSLFIMLVQEKEKLADENKGIGFEIYKNEGKGKKIGVRGNNPDSIALCQGGYQEERQVSLDIQLDKGSYFLIPTTYYPKTHLGYFLIVWHQMENAGRTIKVTELI